MPQNHSRVVLLNILVESPPGETFPTVQGAAGSDAPLFPLTCLGLSLLSPRHSVVPHSSSKTPPVRDPIRHFQRALTHPQKHLSELYPMQWDERKQQAGRDSQQRFSVDGDGIVFVQKLPGDVL